MYPTSQQISFQTTPLNVQAPSTMMGLDQPSPVSRNETQNGGGGGGIAHAEFALFNSQRLQSDLEAMGNKIKQHEDNLKFLKSQKNKLDEAIVELQVHLSKLHSSPTPRSENGDTNVQGEEINEKILRHENSAAGVLGLVETRHGAQASQLMLTKGVVGVVAKLGKVNDENLSRILSNYLGTRSMLAVVCKNYNNVPALESYDNQGNIDRNAGLHGLGASIGRTIGDNFDAICLENLRPYVGQHIADDPQRRLDLLKPKLPNGECPPGFLGFAVNMIQIDPAYLLCVTSYGYGLRETLFYSLFSRLQVYKTRVDMISALPCISDGAISLDGGIIRTPGIINLGNRDEVNVRFAKPTVSRTMDNYNLRNFNTALLGKLAWRIVQHPESLFAKVLLGKYCHSSSFLSANCAASASHGWRSIIAGRDLLRSNLGWAVGDGKSIRIWDEPWLSLSAPQQPMGPAPLNAKDLLVHDLFAQGTVDWDSEKVKSLLPAYEAEILALKPSRLGAKDKQVWLGHPSGEYSTKSGYNSALRESCKTSEPSTQADINWKSEVWDIRTAPKIKIFLWKAVQGALPTGSQLLSRHLDVNAECCRCREEETIAHLLFSCRFAQNVWNLAPFKSSFSCIDVVNVRTGLANAKMQVCLPPTGLGTSPLFPWICWNLWKARNQKLFNEKSFSVEEVLNKSIRDAKEWQEAQEVKRLPAQVTLELTRVPSSPLHLGSIRCKSDAAWKKDLKVAGLGWTFLEHSSGTPSLFSATCEEVASPLMAESLACRAALMDALKKGVAHLLYESDCQTLVRAINSKVSVLEIHGILADILICIKSFSSFLCNHIPRTSNVVADGLAKQALALYEPIF